MADLLMVAWETNAEAAQVPSGKTRPAAPWGGERDNERRLALAGKRKAWGK